MILSLPSLLAAFYLQGGVAYYQERACVQPGYTRHYDLTKVKDPYGTMELGFQADPMRQLHVEIAARHASSIATHEDKGINSIEARIRWTPWK